MNRLDCAVVHIARFTFQARSALSIGTGGADGVFDHPIVRDANGLPCIPGTSLAGVLRHLWRQDHDLASTNALFGFQQGHDGAGSRLEVATAVLQDSQGHPVQGLLLGAAGELRLRDPVLGPALTTREDPNIRDRVRLSHRGVAQDTGKFDRGLLLAGYRFSGEIRLWSPTTDDPDWPQVLALLSDPRMRLGGGTRAGLGAMALPQLSAGSFDLRQAADRTHFAALGTDLSLTQGLTHCPMTSSPAPAVGDILSITLAPRDFWRVGQGSRSFRSTAQLAQGKVPDLLPKQEAVVIWDDQGHARISRRFALVPGSAVKGALAHRTAYHWNLLAGQFAEEMPADTFAAWDKSDHCPGVRALFGHAKDRAPHLPETAQDSEPSDVGAPVGRAGLVLVDDAYVAIDPARLEEQVQTLIHNSIDRFTGGVRKRMLFTEELIYRQPIQLRITLLPAVAQAEPRARRAFARALGDLCTGRLALGAGATKGHGSFQGQPDEHTRAWLAAQGETWA